MPERRTSSGFRLQWLQGVRLIPLVIALNFELPDGWAQIPLKTAVPVKLKAFTLEDPQCVPLRLRSRLGEEGFVFGSGQRLAARAEKGVLHVDLEGSGRFGIQLKPKTTLIHRPKSKSGDTTGRSEPSAWLIANDLVGWWIAPASGFKGTLNGERLEFLDGDADGVIAPGSDWVRYEQSAWHPLDEQRPWVVGKNLLGSVLLEDSGKGLTARMQPLQQDPSWQKSQWEALLACNQFRVGNGLAPLGFDPQLSDACQKHALYLQLNRYDYSAPWDGVGSHDEDPAKPGYTPEGRNAAQKMSTAGNGNPAETIVKQTRTMLHRLSYLGSTEGGLGVGSVFAGSGGGGSYSVVGADHPMPMAIADIVVVPAPGSAGVPTHIVRERPPVEANPQFYDNDHGYPISVTFGMLRLSSIEMQLFDSAGRLVPCEVFTPERPIHSTRSANGYTAFLVALKPLSGKSEYTVRFAAKHNSEQLSLSWTFQTG